MVVTVADRSERLVRAADLALQVDNHGLQGLDPDPQQPCLQMVLLFVHRVAGRCGSKVVFDILNAPLRVVIPGIEEKPVLHAIVQIRSIRDGAQPEVPERNRFRCVCCQVELLVIGCAIDPRAVDGSIVHQREAVTGKETDRKITRQRGARRIAAHLDLLVLRAQRCAAERILIQDKVALSLDVGHAPVYRQLLTALVDISQPVGAGAAIRLRALKLGEGKSGGRIVSRRESVFLVVAVVFEEHPRVQEREFEPGQIDVGVQAEFVLFAPDILEHRELVVPGTGIHAAIEAQLHG